MGMFDLSRNVRACPSPKDYRVSPRLLVREAKPGLGARAIDMHHALSNYLKAPHAFDCCVRPITELELILKVSHRCLGGLTERIFTFLRNDEFRSELHSVCYLSTSAPKKRSYVATA
jgi:hypothetical protein